MSISAKVIAKSLDVYHSRLTTMRYIFCKTQTMPARNSKLCSELTEHDTRLWKVHIQWIKSKGPNKKMDQSYQVKVSISIGLKYYGES